MFKYTVEYRYFGIALSHANKRLSVVTTLITSFVILL